MQRRRLGIVGGMGSLASAEFVKTIYECRCYEREQEAPVVILYSDPTFPDRTDALLRGAYADLLQQLCATVQKLYEEEATDIILCCITLHYLLPMVPVYLRARIISLVDIIFAEIEQTHERHLMLCTRGTNQLRLFQNHEKGSMLAERVIMPDADDQDRIHTCIYHLKNPQNVDLVFPMIEALLLKYGVTSFIAGCTEIHLLAKYLSPGRGKGSEKAYRCLDPLTTLAHKLTSVAVRVPERSLSV
jgi:aspartate racemase